MQREIHIIFMGLIIIDMGISIEIFISRTIFGQNRSPILTIFVAAEN